MLLSLGPNVSLWIPARVTTISPADIYALSSGNSVCESLLLTAVVYTTVQRSVDLNKLVQTNAFSSGKKQLFR